MKEKVALITGGSRRIGAAIVRGLHERGFTIAIHYRESSEQAHQLSKQLNQIRSNSVATFGSIDLADFEECSKLVDSVYEYFGRLDVLINNASVFQSTAFGESWFKRTSEMLAVNCIAPYQLAQAAAPKLQISNGTIVNISDIYANFPKRNFSIYCATKASLESLTRSAAMELAPAVRVNAIALGAILWPDGHSTDQDQVIFNTPLKRLGTTEEVASAVSFLACDATFMTGQILTIDGGRTIALSQTTP